MKMENQPFEDVSPLNYGGFIHLAMLVFLGMYSFVNLYP